MNEAEIKARLDRYYACETAILAGQQSYTVEGTVFTRASLDTVTRQIAVLEARLSALRNGGSLRQTQVVF